MTVSVTDLKSSGATKLTGESENYAATIEARDGRNRLDVEARDVVGSGGSQGTLTVGTTAVAARVGGSNLTGRVLLSVYADTRTVYWGYTNAVTTSTGLPIWKGTERDFPVGPNTTIYLITDVAAQTVRVAEGAQ
jgi:hypothetical protein